jgi:hypothetical protein
MYILNSFQVNFMCLPLLMSSGNVLPIFISCLNYSWEVNSDNQPRGVLASEMSKPESRLLPYICPSPA